MRQGLDLRPLEQAVGQVLAPMVAGTTVVEPMVVGQAVPPAAPHQTCEPG
jgi:hypothetical protein